MDFMPLLAFASAAYDASHLCALTLSCSLANNELGPEGCKAVSAVLGKTQITSLKCASLLAQRLTICVDFVPWHGFSLAAFDAVLCALPFATP